jgi:hypothetical protein
MRLLLVLLLSGICIASELDLPVLKPDDPLRTQYVPGTLPTPPETELPPLEPLPTTFFGEEITLAKHDSVVFVLDKSSSMEGGRWERVVDETLRAIAGIKDNWWGVVVFDSHCPAWHVFQQRLLEPTEENRNALTAWLGTFQPLSATNTSQAMIMAFQLGATRAVLLTDGVPNVNNEGRIRNPAWHQQRIQRHNPGVVIDVFGLGIQSNPVARGFCVGVATDSGGIYYQLD